MKAIVQDLDIADAKTIMQYVYDSDRSATFQGSWNRKRHVIGAVVTATAEYDDESSTGKPKDGVCMVTIQSNAISTMAGLKDYVPPRFRDKMREVVTA